MNKKVLEIIQTLISAFGDSSDGILERIEEQCEVSYEEFFAPKNRHNLGWMPSYTFIDDRSKDLTKAVFLALHWSRVKGGIEIMPHWKMNHEHSSGNNFLDIIDSLLDEARLSDPRYHELIKEDREAKEKSREELSKDLEEIRIARIKSANAAAHIYL